MGVNITFIFIRLTCGISSAINYYVKRSKSFFLFQKWLLQKYLFCILPYIYLCGLINKNIAMIFRQVTWNSDQRPKAVSFQQKKNNRWAPSNLTAWESGRVGLWLCHICSVSRTIIDLVNVLGVGCKSEKWMPHYSWLSSFFVCFLSLIVKLIAWEVGLSWQAACSESFMTIHCKFWNWANLIEYTIITIIC